MSLRPACVFTLCITSHFGDMWCVIGGCVQVHSLGALYSITGLATKYIEDGYLLLLFSDFFLPSNK